MSRYIGSRSFYRRVFLLSVPIMVQNGITNFVALLDNIMIGQIGTEYMSGVSIVNQLIFVFNLCIFGAISGAGIFSAQFFGKGNREGLMHTVRFKLIICGILVTAAIAILLLKGQALIGLYLHEGTDTADIALTFREGRKYLEIMLLGLVPYALAQVYASTLRETGRTVTPMVAGVAAVVTNTLLNYILIFGKFGAPRLGVEGAAIATVIARYLECAIVVLWTHIHHRETQFVEGLYRSLRIPRSLTADIVKKGMPLLANELLWSSGIAIITQCYASRGLAVVAALNICITISNVFGIIYLALGNAVGIIVGQLLGGQKMEEAKDTATKLVFFSVLCGLVMGALMAVAAPFFPRIYNTGDDVRTLASQFILVAAVIMPLNAFTHSAYFVLRSGGKTMITFLFDSAFVWAVNIPSAFLLTRFTGLPIVLIYLFCSSTDLIKCIVGAVMMRKGIWLNNIVDTV